ncbi:MAG: transglutaminase-like domain-containing protein [Verrucomicrobiota bacterium]
MLPSALKIALFALVFTSATFNAIAKPIIKGEDNFEFIYQATIPQLTEDARLWLPLAQSDRNQKVDTVSITAPGDYLIQEESKFGNRYLFVELSPKMSGRTVEIVYTVQRTENTGEPLSELGENAAKYLTPSSLVPRNARLANIAKQATSAYSNHDAKARKLYWHTLEEMRYDKSGAGWGRGDAMRACDSKNGNCTDFHSYFIALARTQDVPARFSIGFTIPADRNEGKIKGYHCWAEFYTDGKWTPVDISEADKYPELQDYYLGNHPANRFQFTVGRDLELEPAPQSGPLNYHIYPHLEVAGEPVEVETYFRYKRL